MSDKAEAAINMALLAKVAAFAAAQSIADVSYPGLKFTPPVMSPSAKWLRATIMPADAFALSINNGGPNQYYGILQIDVFYAQGVGEMAPVRIASEVASYFKFGTTMTQDGFTVLVMDVPRVRQSSRDDPWVMVPVRIPYRALAIPT